MRRNLLVIGTGWAGQEITTAILEASYGKVCGFSNSDTDHGNESSNESKVQIVHKDGIEVRIPIIKLSQLRGNWIEEHQITEIVLATSNGSHGYLQGFLVRCYEAGIRVWEMADLYTKLLKKVPVKHIEHKWIVPRLSAPPHGLYMLFHDAANYLAGIAGLLAVLPAIPIISAMIRLDSSGPVFYRQKRVGKNGEYFTMIKFRTMINDAEQRGDSWTKKDDERITKFGRWLRKYRLDEIPQLINILRGEMALIGPRPDAVDLADNFRGEIPFYDYRHLVRPGVTGWAQVNHGNTCTMEGALEKLQYDLYWIKNRSFWLDLKIVVKSIKVIVTGYGAV